MPFDEANNDGWDWITIRSLLKRSSSMEKPRCLRASWPPVAAACGPCVAVFIERCGWVIWPSAHSSFTRFTGPHFGEGCLIYDALPPPPPPAAPISPLSLPSENILPSARCLTRFHSAAVSDTSIVCDLEMCFLCSFSRYLQRKGFLRCRQTSLSLTLPPSVADCCVTVTSLWLGKMKF